MKNRIGCILAFICFFSCGNLYAVATCGTSLQPGCPVQTCDIVNITGGTRYTYYPIPCGQTGTGGITCMCSACDVGMDCETYSCECNAGYYAVNQGNPSCSCSVCPANTYSTTKNTSTSCTACPTGAFTVGTGYSYHDQATDCVCDQGQYLNGNACARCPLAAKTTSGVDVYGITALYGYYITECYLQIGTYGEGNGIYDMTSSCYYTN